MVAADIKPDADMHHDARMTEQIKERFEIYPRDANDRKSVFRPQYRVERSGYGLGRGDLDRRHKVKQCFLVVVLRANANQSSAMGIGEAGDPGGQRSPLLSQVEIV